MDRTAAIGLQSIRSASLPDRMIHVRLILNQAFIATSFGRQIEDREKYVALHHPNRKQITLVSAVQTAFLLVHRGTFLPGMAETNTASNAPVIFIRR
jgi:hypothetical protein